MSEVAQLLEQIRLEYDAAQKGLYGLASGTARHDFINKKLERIEQCHETLLTLVGRQAAIQVLAKIFEQQSEELGEQHHKQARL